MNEIEFLIGEAVWIEGGEDNSERRERLLNRLANPKWEGNGRVHDWRNHVSAVVREVWNGLPIEARLVAYIDACSDANSEEWE